MNCRSCGNPLKIVFADLGECPPSNSYLSAGQLDQPEAVYPLKVFVCEHCFLVQVDEHKQAEEIFDSKYAYFSSYSKTWLDHARRYVEMAADRFELGRDSQVVEIASNDGYLLQYFVEKEIPVLGIEPTASTAAAAREKDVDTREVFFGVDTAKQLVAEGKQADLLLGNNVLAHVPDINDFVEGLKIALKPGGTITLEFPHVLKLIRENQFDTIYHEHFSYLSLFTTREIFARHSLTIFDVDELPTHGGSLRVYAAHTDEQRSETASFKNVLADELNAGINTPELYSGFQQRIESVRHAFVEFLERAKSEGRSVAAYGAAAKGNTLLNYCGVRSEEIPFVVDASPHKQGLYLPGSRIPIVDESHIRRTQPDFVIILPWNIKDEIAGQLAYTREWACRFVTAIPSLEVW
jgi:SAM-dependent methyltransferase